MKRFNIFLALLMAGLLAFAGCSKKDANENSGGETPSTETEDQKDEGKAEGPAGAEGKLSAVFLDVMKSGKYTIKYKTLPGPGSTAESFDMTLAKDGNMQAFTSNIGGEEQQTVMKDKKIYIIDHQNKMVSVMDDVSQNGTSGDALSPTDIDYAAPVFADSGQAEFMGQMRDYEEYKDDKGGIRYYFDGKDLIGMEMNNDGKVLQWQIEMFSGEVDKAMFDIPADYEVFNIGG